MLNLKPCSFLILLLLLAACNDAIKYPEGGYDYPEHVADKDTNFYFYPLKDVMSKKDSLFYSVSYMWLKQFNEPNLSLQPLGTDQFRLVYQGSFTGYYILTLTQNAIEIKKQNINEEYLFDPERLSEFEQLFYHRISYYYPYDNVRSYNKRYIDSLRISNPPVLSPSYFVHVMEKGYKHFEPQKLYTVKRINIDNKTFTHLITTINNSGYWRTPYSIPYEYLPMDGYSFYLEANTKHKYNFVSSGSCNDTDEQVRKFAKACNEIVKYAYMEKEIYISPDILEIITEDSLDIPDVPVEDIPSPVQKNTNTKPNLPPKESTVQGSDTTKMP